MGEHLADPVPASWGTNGRVWTTIRVGVVAGGHYGFIDGLNVPKLSAFDLTGALNTGWRPRPNSAKAVWTVAPSPDLLLVGGDFTMIGNAADDRFAACPVS